MLVRWRDAHQPFVLAQLLPDLAGRLEQPRRGLVDLPQHVVERFLGHLGVVAQGLQRLLLALELLQEVRFQVGAARDLEDLEDREQRDVVLLRFVLVQKIIDALEEILEPQQRAHALAQWIFVADHVVRRAGLALRTGVATDRGRKYSTKTLKKIKALLYSSNVPR